MLKLIKFKFNVRTVFASLFETRVYIIFIRKDIGDTTLLDRVVKMVKDREGHQLPGTRYQVMQLQTDSKSSINGNFDPLCTQLQHSENLSCSANTCVPHQTS